MDEPGRVLGVLPRVERLDRFLAVLALLIEVLGVFLLNLAGVGHHDGGEVARGRRAINRAAETLAHQVRQIAAVIDVGMAKHHRVDLGGLEWKVAVPLPCLGPLALIQPAVQQKTPACRLDQVHRAGNGSGGAPESNGR